MEGRGLFSPILPLNYDRFGRRERMSNVVMEVQQITKVIGKRQVIHDSSFQLDKGKIYGFIGPNGVGKTTLMRMMTGLMHPTSGHEC
jgi:ABC-type multidrug transport system ATPase subunit